jgi:TPR repeat protein
VTKDETEAVKWYGKAADQDLAEAQLSLGNMYALGRGVTKDDAMAYKWFLLASEKGQQKAKSNMRYMEVTLTADKRAEGERMAREFKPRGKVKMK